MWEDELLQEDLMDCPRRLVLGAIFQAAERGTAGQFAITVHRRLPQQVIAQGGVVIQIFVARCQAVDALAQEIDLAMGDQSGVARIGQRSIYCTGETESPVSLPQKHQPAVATHIATAKICFDFAAIEAWKIQKSLRTIWHSEFVC